jgi:hypothetical protein
MDSGHRARWLRRAATALLWGLCWQVAASDGATDPVLPAWQALVFEQRAFGVTARSRLEVDRWPGRDDGALRLTADSAVSSNTETVNLTLAPGDARVLRRTRLSSGRDQRYKTWDYRPAYVLRERREPRRGAGADPDQWPVSSRRKLDYPAAAGELVITDVCALLLLAGRFQAGSAETLEVAVLTDINFYRVRMTRGPVQEIPVDYRLSGDDRREHGKRRTRAVTVEYSALGTPEDKPDFSLLGLQDEITLLYEEGTGLLVQVRGIAPRLGYTTLQLRQVTLRDRET